MTKRERSGGRQCSGLRCCCDRADGSIAEGKLRGALPRERSGGQRGTKESSCLDREMARRQRTETSAGDRGEPRACGYDRRFIDLNHCVFLGKNHDLVEGKQY